MNRSDFEEGAPEDEEDLFPMMFHELLMKRWRLNSQNLSLSLAQGKHPDPHYWFGKSICVNPVVLMSRNIGVRGGSNNGFRKFASKI
jgi:hypothetical protein